MTINNQKLIEIQKDLIALQAHGVVVMADLRRSNENLYKHLSKLYLWWRVANEQEGYLQKEYATLNRIFKTVNYGINFSPLLVLAYGHNNIDKNGLDRYSRALNSIHEEYNKKLDFYAKNGVTKLVNFITQSGGIKNLTGYAQPKDNTPDPIESDDLEDEKIEISIENELVRRRALLLLTDYIGIHGEHDTVKYPAYIKADSQNFSVLLVQKTSDGFNILDTKNDAAIIQNMLLDNVSRRFDVAVQSIRPILEIIETQCLPKSVEDLVDKLIDTTKLPDENNKKFQSHRRILYTPLTNEFILSPINALSGVVSIVKPFFALILENCDKDVFVPIIEREQLETRLIRNFEFNLYNAEQHSPPIPKYPEYNSASHVVHLRHRSKSNDFINISFWPFYDTLPQPQDQLILDPTYKFETIWHAHINRNEIKRINDLFLEKWLEGHAKYLKRSAHELIKITFNANYWQIEFVYQENQFVNIEKISIQAVEASKNSITALFKTKDIVPVLKSLSSLPINEVFDNTTLNQELIEGTFIPPEAADYKGGIWVELNENLLCIKFSTFVFGGCEHTIYVPTVDTEGHRTTKPFMRYHPQITTDLATTLETSEDEL